MLAYQRTYCLESHTSLIAWPCTSGLSSIRYLTVSSARNLPSDSSSRKKLTPKSASSTRAGSRILNWPTPGRTRFLRVSTAVTPGDELISRRCVASRAICPGAPQSPANSQYRVKMLEVTILTKLPVVSLLLRGRESL